MSGIARIYKDLFQADYVAGLWSTAILQGMAWESDGGQYDPIRKYSGPSWSWAGYNGTTWASSTREKWTWYATVQKWQVELKDEFNPYGQVTTARIQLHGPIVELNVTFEKHHQAPFRFFTRTTTDTPWRLGFEAFTSYSKTG